MWCDKCGAISEYYKFTDGDAPKCEHVWKSGQLVGQGVHHNTITGKLDRIAEMNANRARAYEELTSQILKRYGQLFPNYVWTDADSAVDLMAAEITAQRSDEAENILLRRRYDDLVQKLARALEIAGDLYRYLPINHGDPGIEKLRERLDTAIRGAATQTVDISGASATMQAGGEPRRGQDLPDAALDPGSDHRPRLGAILERKTAEIEAANLAIWDYRPTDSEVDDLKLELARVTLECAQYRQRLNIKRIMFKDARRDIVGLIALLDTFLGGSEEEYSLSVKPTEAAMVEDIRMRWGVQDDGVTIGASLLCESSGPKPTAATPLDSSVGEKP